MSNPPAPPFPAHPIACPSCGGGGGNRFLAGAELEACPACGRVAEAPAANPPMPDQLTPALPPMPVLGADDEQKAEAVEAFWEEQTETIVELYKRHPERRLPGGPDVTTER